MGEAFTEAGKPRLAIVEAARIVVPVGTRVTPPDGRTKAGAGCDTSPGLDWGCQHEITVRTKVGIPMGSAPRPYIAGRWFLVWVTLLAGVGCLVGLTVNWVDAANLQAHAIHAVATVEAIGQEGRNKSYLITFAKPDGMPESLWTVFLHDGTQVGDRVRITYDAQRVDNLREGIRVDPASVVVPSMYLVSLAVFFLWTSLSALKAEPTGLTGWIMGSKSPADEINSKFRPSALSPNVSEK